MKQPLHIVIGSRSLLIVERSLGVQLNVILGEHDVLGYIPYYGPIWEAIKHQCLLPINGFCLQ